MSSTIYGDLIPFIKIVYLNKSVAIVEVLVIESYASWLFLAYFIHFVAENNHILEPLPPLHVIIIINDVFGGVYGAALYHNYASFTYYQLVVIRVFCEQKNCVLAAHNKMTTPLCSLPPKI